MGWSIRFRSCRLGVREKVAQFKSHCRNDVLKVAASEALDEHSTRHCQVNEAEAVFALKHARTFSFSAGTGRRLPVNRRIWRSRSLVCWWETSARLFSNRQSRDVARWFRRGLSVSSPFGAGASRAGPCPVSTSRSSNRTCGFPASGFHPLHLGASS